MAKIGKLSGPSNAQGTVTDRQIYLPRTDLTLTGSGSDLTTDGDITAAGDATIGGTVTGGGVTVGTGAAALAMTSAAATSASPVVLAIAGAINTFHDFFLIPATAMTTDGTAPTIGQTVPRCILAKGQSVAWAVAIPAGWPVCTSNFLWMKESAGSGNVHWQLSHKVVNFLTGGDLAGALTDVDVGGVAVPAAVGTSKYTIPAGTQAIPSPQQVFGLPPLLHVVLTRIDDGSDTYAPSVGVTHSSVSRAS